MQDSSESLPMDTPSGRSCCIRHDRLHQQPGPGGNGKLVVRRGRKATGVARNGDLAGLPKPDPSLGTGKAQGTCRIAVVAWSRPSLRSVRPSRFSVTSRPAEHRSCNHSRLGSRRHGRARGTGSPTRTVTYATSATLGPSAGWSTSRCASPSSAWRRPRAAAATGSSPPTVVCSASVTARFRGSLGNIALAQPIVGMTRSAHGRGYYLVAADGGVFSFGDAHYEGSASRVALSQPIVGIAATRSGRGYWLVAADGGVFTFGDARFHGSAATRVVCGRRSAVSRRHATAAPTTSSPSTRTSTTTARRRTRAARCLAGGHLSAWRTRPGRGRS